MLEKEVPFVGGRVSVLNLPVDDNILARPISVAGRDRLLGISVLSTINEQSS